MGKRACCYSKCTLVTDLRGITMFPLPLLASVLGTSGGGVTQPVPRPSPPQTLGPLHGNTPVSSADAEEAGPAFFHTSLLCLCTCQWFLMGTWSKKADMPHKVFLPRTAVTLNRKQTNLPHIQCSILLLWLFSNPGKVLGAL